MYDESTFVRYAVLRGVCAEINAIKYVKESGKDSFDEDDIAELYRQMTKPVIKKHARPKLCADGQNMQSPSAMPNSTYEVDEVKHIYNYMESQGLYTPDLTYVRDKNGKLVRNLKGVK